MDNQVAKWNGNWNDGEKVEVRALGFRFQGFKVLVMEFRVHPKP